MNLSFLQYLVRVPELYEVTKTSFGRYGVRSEVVLRNERDTILVVVNTNKRGTYPSSQWTHSYCVVGWGF